MASKLKPLLDKLLSPNQTGFLKKRSILHGFHYAQQVLQSVTRQHVQIAVLKADIFKAFDTLSWQFLLDSLTARGFPQAWVQSVQTKVLMGKLRIIINSVAGKDIRLRRGVRQRDPLSPYLFNLAIDLLPRWIEKLKDLHFLASPFPQCCTCLLYADDTLLLLRPTRDQLSRTKLIFNLFGQISGLKVNLLKSEIALTSSSPLLLQTLADVMQCRPQKFPIKYLGLPLSDKALTAVAYLPIIEKTQASLAGWKASLLSIGGRLVLTNSVISVIPIYFMSVFRLPKWVLKRIDKIRKKFLWHGHKNLQSQGKGLYMVNWALATRPRQLGGIGVRDIQITNHALLMKWMWQWYDQRNAWWTLITPLLSSNDKPWQASNGSSFWKSLATVAPAFHSSTLFKIGNGLSMSFWHDNWHDKPLNLLFPNLYQSVQNKTVSVAHCLQDRSWSLLTSPLGTVAQNERDELLHSLLQVHLTPQQDEVTWLRSSNGFSVRSAYNFLSQTPSPISNVQHI